MLSLSGEVSTDSNILVALDAYNRVTRKVSERGYIILNKDVDVTCGTREHWVYRNRIGPVSFAVTTWRVMVLEFNLLSTSSST